MEVFKIRKTPNLTKSQKLTTGGKFKQSIKGPKLVKGNNKRLRQVVESHSRRCPSFASKLKHEGLIM